MPTYPFNIAHRGFSAKFPENTLIAFQQAAQIGADMIELDVSNSSDGDIIVLHDDTLDRTTTSTGLASAQTVPQIKRLDAGSWFAPEFAGETIPTLAETFVALQDTQLQFCIEIKRLDEGVDVRRVIETIIAIINDHKMRRRSILIGFEGDYLGLVKEIDPLLTTGYNPGYRDRRSAWDVVQEARKINADLTIPHYSWLTAEFVYTLHVHGLPMWVWTVNKEAEMQQALSAGVDGIITNHPDKLQAILKYKK